MLLASPPPFIAVFFYIGLRPPPLPKLLTARILPTATVNGSLLRRVHRSTETTDLFKKRVYIHILMNRMSGQVWARDRVCECAYPVGPGPGYFIFSEVYGAIAVHIDTCTRRSPPPTRGKCCISLALPSRPVWPWWMTPLLLYPALLVGRPPSTVE